MPTNLDGLNDNVDLENSHALPAFGRKFVDADASGASSVSLWGTGSPRREFLHVDDLASAVLHCVEKCDDEKLLNIGTRIDVVIKELTDMVSKASGFHGEIR